MNPVENEAVIHRLLKESDGSLQLIDAFNDVPGLKYSPGLSYWELSTNDCTEFYKTFDQVPEEFHTIIRPQMFPPEKNDISKYSLNKCMRILPHYQNTGGFFVAILTKTKALPWTRKNIERVEMSKNTDSVASNDNTAEEKSAPWGPQRKKRRTYGYKEDPYVFFTDDDPVWKSIKSFYDIDPDKVTAFKPTHLLSRTETGKKKNIYFCSGSVKELVQNNETNLKIINTGVKVFARCDNRNMTCAFRLANEGLSSISDTIGESRRIEVTKEDLVTMLNHTNPTDPPKLSSLSEATQNRIKDITAGSCLLIYNDEHDFTLTLVGWRATQTLRAYTDLHDSIHMLRMLGSDVSRYDVNKFKKIDENSVKKEDERSGDENIIENDESDVKTGEKMEE